MQNVFFFRKLGLDGMQQLYCKQIGLRSQIVAHPRDTHDLMTCDCTSVPELNLNSMRIRAQSDERPAAVFDLDRTLIDRHGQKRHETCRLLEELHRLGLLVFIVTARTEDGRGYAEDQLSDLLLPYDGLYLHKLDMPIETAADVGRQKALWRSTIEKEHDCTVRISVGDQWSDHFACGTSHFPSLCVFTGPDTCVHLKLT